jgi:hypothetical protein
MRPKKSPEEAAQTFMGMAKKGIIERSDGQTITYEDALRHERWLYAGHTYHKVASFRPKCGGEPI